MKVTFKYRKEKTREGEIIYRPIAKVILVGPAEKEITVYMYIDSGADFTLIPYRLGLYIGLTRNQKKIKQIQGISGTIDVIYSQVDLTIGKIAFPAKIVWAQTENVPLLLGRADVFDRFKVIFDQKKKRIVFESP